MTGKPKKLSSLAMAEMSLLNKNELLSRKMKGADWRRIEKCYSTKHYSAIECSARLLVNAPLEVPDRVRS